MNKYNRCKMCVSGITECSITGTSSPEANLWFDAGNNTERHRHINACKNKRWKFKAYRSNGGNFSLKQANVCCVYWTRSAGKHAEKKTVCLCTAEWKIVLRRLPWEKRSLCRAGFEMTGKPKPMRKKERDKYRERKQQHMLLMNGEAPSSSFVFLFLQPWQDILGIQASGRHTSHRNTTVILAHNCTNLLKLLEPYTTGIMILVCNELPVSISEPTRQI